MAAKLAGEALKYLKKLGSERKKRMHSDDVPSTKKKPKRVSEMSDERLKREQLLLDPDLTYEQRVELLGGKYKKGGSVKKMKHGGSVKSHRGDGICKKGKTKGRMV